jgi:hypothetical protein
MDHIKVDAQYGPADRESMCNPNIEPEVREEA